MRLPTNRYAVFAIGAAAGLIVGAVADRGPVIPQALAESANFFTETGRAIVPATHNAVVRMVDKETGAVCYYGKGFFSCIKK